MNITENGNYPIGGISPGRQYSLIASGTFGGATVAAQIANAAPAKAALTIDDADEDAAIVLTATDGGTQGNSISVGLLDPAAPNSPLSVTQDARIFDISLATGIGDAASTTIGAGANGTITITAEAAGVAGNLLDVQVVAGSGNNQPMTAIISGANARTRVVVTLGTDANGDADDAKNTATLVAAAINALPLVSATASGTGATAIPVTATKALTGGGANAAITTTVGELLAFLQSNAIFWSHFTADLAEDADPDALMATLAETALTGGTDGTFQGYTTAVSLTAAGDRVARNVGILPVINLAVSNASETTDINIEAIEIIE